MILQLLFILLIFNIIVLLIGFKSLKFKLNTIKIFTLSLNIAIFVLSLLLWLYYDNTAPSYQFLLIYNTMRLNFGSINVFFGIDGYSLFIILLTTLIFPVCIITSWENEKEIKFRLLCLLLIEFFLIVTFSSLNIFLFFIAFEAVLIPMFIIIGLWGSNVRRIKASYYFFIYTFFGSIFILFAILFLYTQYGTLNYYTLRHLDISFSNQIVLWICLFLPFAIKAPIFPFHVWLPEAHVEAPTDGSILLASLMLKLGIYGMLRFLIPLCPDANIYFLPISYTILLVGLVYTSITTLRQTDLKRIIAYSSVAHMTYVVLGIITYNYQSIQGAVVLMLAHGLTSAGLFFLIGTIYNRTHTRLLNYYSGVVSVMPLFTVFIFLFCVANFSLPLTFNFIGEFIIILGLFQQNLFVAIFSTISIFLSLLYSMWFFNRISFANLQLNYIIVYTDLSRRELYILILLSILMFLFGVVPNLILQTIDITVKLHML
jgi:proton-translocating NADH-quinone oxidoreductase chain M